MSKTLAQKVSLDTVRAMQLPAPGVCGVYGAPGVIGLNATGDGVPPKPVGDGVVWKLPPELGENVLGLSATPRTQHAADKCQHQTWKN